MRCCTLAILLVLSTGCGEENGKTEGANPEPVQEGVHGTALFKGDAPPARTIQVNKDAAECKHAAGEVQDVVVSGTGGLADVIIEVQGVKAEKDWEKPEEGYVIRQKNCRFDPHILIMASGEELTVHNDDPVLHNINTGSWNIAQASGAKPFKKKMKYQGRPFIRVNCNVHSWMEAWVYVARSPWYARTGADGTFRIEGLPSGSYKVTASHPTLGTRRGKITVEDGKPVELNFEFK